MSQDVKERRKRLIGGVILAALVFHFGLTFLYTAPVEIVGRKGKEVAGFYVGPVAHQYWRLFAPDVPKDNHRLVYWYQTSDGVWSSKQDPIREYLDVHRDFRITWHGKMAVGIYNLGFEIEKYYSYFKERGEEPDWRSTTPWYNVMFFARKYAELQSGEKVVAVRARLDVVYPDGDVVVIELPVWKDE